MDLDTPNEAEDYNGNDSSVKEDGHPQPVLPDTTGEGFPYAPENFPDLGDNWHWRVGKRVTVTGHYRDRYLYPPKRLKHLRQKKLHLKSGFSSKLSLEHFIKDEFPDADINAFFNSFIWKIPSMKIQLANGIPDRRIFFALPHRESPEPSSSDSDSVGCKARNRKCISLIPRPNRLALPLMPCDICCSEPRFCRDCCCILCSKTVDFIHGDCSFIRCEALIGQEGFMCSHLAHLNCGLRSYMAGTIGGSIGLDAEYYCRRCDSRTELVPHVAKLFDTCKAVGSRDEVEELLNMGVSILHGSQKTSAQLLFSSIHSALSKLKRGNPLEEIWRGEDGSAFHILNNESSSSLLMNNDSPGLEVSERKNSSDACKQKGEPSEVSDASGIQLHYQKLEAEVNQTLQELREVQDSEYRMAEEQLHAQKNYLHNLFQQLGHEIAEQKKRGMSSDLVSKRKDQIKREYKKFLEMKELAKGFGRTSKQILTEHFGFGLEEQLDT